MTLCCYSLVIARHVHLSELESVSPTHAPVQTPWAWVSCWAARPPLLCLGQTTSGVRKEAQSSRLFGEENIPLSPIPPSLRVDRTVTSHFPTAQQIFRPKVHTTAQGYRTGRLTSCHPAAFSRESGPKPRASNTDASNAERHPHLTFRRRASRLCADRRQDERGNRADRARRARRVVSPRLQSAAASGNNSRAGTQRAQTQAPNGGGTQAGRRARSAGPAESGSTRQTVAQGPRTGTHAHGRAHRGSRVQGFGCQGSCEVADVGHAACSNCWIAQQPRHAARWGAERGEWR